VVCKSANLALMVDELCTHSPPPPSEGETEGGVAHGDALTLVPPTPP
jgi:hypothetical protein